MSGLPDLREQVTGR